MKKILFTALAASLSLCGYAQTKGTNALGFGVNVNSGKNEYNNSPEIRNENKTRSFTLGYGLFIEDNTRVGLDLNYGTNEFSTNENIDQSSKLYGGNLTYQRYYPLIKTLYAYAGGKAGYSYSKQKNYNRTTNQREDTATGNSYSLGGYGGLTWFVSKCFAFETNLLSANISYNSQEQNNTNFQDYKTKQTSFNMSTDGFIDNLGFKIYLLF